MQLPPPPPKKKRNRHARGPAHIFADLLQLSVTYIFKYYLRAHYRNFKQVMANGPVVSTEASGIRFARFPTVKCISTHM